MSGLPVADTNTERVKDECGKAAFLIPFSNIRHNYILGHIKLRTIISFSVYPGTGSSVFTYPC